MLIGARRLGMASLIFLGLGLAIDRVYFHYARIGLLEPAVNAWIALAMLALLRAERRIEWLIVAQLAFVLAFFTKQAALFALPVIALASAWLLWRAPAAREPRKERLVRGLCVLHALVVGGVSALYMASAQYQRAVAHNVNHVLVGDTDSTRRWRGLWSLLSRIADREKFEHFWITTPLLGTLALGTSLFWLVVLARRRRLPLYEAIALGWFACACVAMLVISKSELRFWTLMLPPAALVAAIGLQTLQRALAAHAPTWVREPHAKLQVVRATWLVFAIPFAIMLVRDARGLQTPLLHPTFTLRDGALKMRAHLGKTDATIVGLASPPLVLGTPYKNFYVREYFNSQRSALQQLGITHILLNDGYDISRNIFKREFPRLLGTLRPSLVLPVRNLKLMLYPVGTRLQNYRTPPPRRSIRPAPAAPFF